MIDAAAVRNYRFSDQIHRYTPRDAILYALGIGLGRNPVDPADLQFLDERAPSVLPTFAVTLCSPGMWIRDPALGVDFARLVHSAQEAEFLSPLPTAGEVTASAKVVSLSDRGAERGAELILERIIAGDGVTLCRLRQTLLLRGDGGFGGPPPDRPLPPAIVGEPDIRAACPISPRSALIYRLSGDWNPLHLDPETARAAGFDRPILQGLASYGMAGVAVSRVLERDPSRVAHLACRFAGVVFPGDTLEFLVWRDGTNGAQFLGRVGDRTVLSNGRIAWSEE